MKLENAEESLLFKNTNIPDVFFTEYLPNATGDAIKVYLYLLFLSKNGGDIKTLDLAKALSMPLETIKQTLTFWEEQGLVLKKQNGYILNSIQTIELYKLYKPKMAVSIDDAMDNAKKNTSRNKAIETIKNSFFQGIISPSWISEIETWFMKYQFDEEVMIALFGYCFDKSKLNKNYVNAVAQGWNNQGVKTYSDLENYFHKYEKFDKIKKSITKKLGLSRKLTEYEEAYIENWSMNFGYSFDVIELALKKTTSKANPNFEYLNTLICDWHDRGFTTPTQVQTFLKEYKVQQSNIKELQKKTTYNSYSQRTYDNLDNLYTNLNVDSNT